MWINLMFEMIFKSEDKNDDSRNQNNCVMRNVLIVGIDYVQ